MCPRIPRTCSGTYGLRAKPRRYRRFALVFAAFFADADRDAALRFLATLRECEASAVRDAAERPSRLSALRVARDRFAEVFLPARFVACLALRFVLALPLRGAGSFTPERRAFESPMAMACSGDRAPCFPSRM